MPGHRNESTDRLDRVLMARGLAPTRAKAQALILAGRVRSGGTRLGKPGLRVPPDAPLEVTPAPAYVSRGGTKLAPALDALRVEVRDREALDVGASTGGFTQVLLVRGARRVAALDVGRGQLDWTLRNDPRVVVLEGVNARYLRPSALPFAPTVSVIDVSFISLELVLPPVAACLSPGGEIVALAKPQFEAGRRSVERGGIVRDPEVHRRVLRRLCDFSRERGIAVRGIVPSSIRGAEGNREFFLHLAPSGEGLAPDALERAIADAASAAPEVDG